MLSCRSWSKYPGYFSYFGGSNIACSPDFRGYGEQNVKQYNENLKPHFQYYDNPKLGGYDAEMDYCTPIISSKLCPAGERCVHNTGSNYCVPVSIVKGRLVVSIDVTCPLSGGNITKQGIEYSCPPTDMIVESLYAECPGINPCYNNGLCVGGKCV